MGSSRRGTEREGVTSALFKNHIGSVDLDAWKIPARKAEYSLTGNAITPFQVEPTHVQVLEVLELDGSIEDIADAEMDYFVASFPVEPTVR